MKLIVNQILKLIIFFWHCLYSYKISLIKRKLGDKIYSFWIGNNIRVLGKNSLIMKDCYLLGGKHIEIGNNSCIARHGVVTCWDNYMGELFKPTIKIGDNCSIGEYCHITSINSIIIGNGVLTGRRVTISDNSHGNSSLEETNILPSKRKLYSKGPVIIEDNVWIGDKVTILAGVRIGANAIIGANSVVTKDVPTCCVVAGNSAKIIKQIKKYDD